MARQEKTLILEMVADGQITPEEGVDLLKVLDTGMPTRRAGYLKAPHNEAPRARVRPETGQAEGELASKQRGGTKEVAGILGQAGVNIGRTIAQMFSGGFFSGPKFEFVEEIKGGVPETGDLKINLRTANGAISVESWDRPTYLLTVTKAARAQNRSVAEEIVKNCFDFKQEGSLLDVHTANGTVFGFPRLSVAFSLKIPSSKKASFSLNSANGRITADSVRGSLCEANTANGRIQMSRCAFEEANLRTANGRIRYEGAAERLDISTANGRIEAGLKGIGDWRFDSQTGRVQIDVRREDDAAYELDLYSNVGKIVVEGLNDAEVVSEEARGGTKGRYRARSRGFERAEKLGFIKASSSVGRIQVLF